MGDIELVEKFNESYKYFNQLFTFIRNYRTPNLASFKLNQMRSLEDLAREINSDFAKFLEEDSLEALNFIVINFYLNDLNNIVENLRVNHDSENIDKYYNYIVDILKKILNELLSNYSNKEINKKIDYLDKNIKNVNELKEQIKNKDTHDIYETAANENQARADESRTAFIVLIVFSIVIVWFCSVTKTYFGLKDYDYWFFKGTLVLTSVTLITYFLKQSVKYQKIADQCRQTKMELEAFPSFVASFTTEDPQIIEIRKELALKYFGRELDNKTNDETSNILQDQMKNTTEMVKAAMEVLKKSGSN
ncbi:hypothetical protein NQ666_12560 [Acinetobacter baumannii]|uniref:hypothetical protein n=1 Tax=Acinetobacter calcoaceticus/baumannii complex TaxID=909768 RepID=UPI001092EC9A|nr:hypothetical protein [Acinetobacter baumannii]MDC4454762.1 hypothetical protein [Acinetobacter baumannii]MDN8575786.1 hypothetical protein [Acinetobacter baumannii]TGO93254.1 hypothetical protein E1953_13435 [Acinetobacter baumannii]